MLRSLSIRKWNRKPFMTIMIVVCIFITTLSHFGFAQSSDQLFEEARQASQSGNYVRLEFIANSIIQQERTYSSINSGRLNRAYFYLGLALRNQGNLPEAEEAYLAAISYVRNDSNSINGLGNVRYSQRRWQEAIDYYNQTIRLNRTNSYAHRNKGLVQEQLGQFDAAASSYKDAITFESNPEAISYNYSLLAGVQRKQGNLSEAIETYRQLLDQLQQGNNRSELKAWTHTNIGSVMQQQGRLLEAQVQYQTALSIEPSYTVALNNLRQINQLLNPNATAIPREEPPSNRELLRGKRPSIVKIDAKLNSGSSTGTGWIIKRDSQSIWIVTARHVVVDEIFDSQQNFRPGQISKEVTVEFYTESDNPLILLAQNPITVTEVSSSLDVALLEVRNAPAYIQKLDVSPNSAEALDDVYIIGHTVNEYSGGSWLVLGGKVASNDRQRDVNILKLGNFTGILDAGFSGAPILNSEGNVVGIVTTKDTSVNTPGPGRFGFGYAMQSLRAQLQFWKVI